MKLSSVSAWLLAGVLGVTSAAWAAAQSLPDFTALVEQNSPSVVNISTKQRKSIRNSFHGFQMPDLPDDSPFNELFKKFFGEGGGLPEEYDAQSLGSGFIIQPDGYILTNYHVVSEAEEILVRTSDRKELVATVIGGDKRSDIALIKVDATDLPVAKIGRSSELKVGEWVLAIGSPFGFDHSVTAGIVSAKGRNLPTENYVPFIQTDVAINPGNSGGPLFDLEGNVVGVNSQIFSRTGGFMGLSFAIPIDVAMSVADQLRTKGKVSRGWLGVIIQDVTRELAESFGMEQSRGALVSKVLPNSPAASAGMQVGDVIVSFNGRDVTSSATLPPLVGASPVEEAAEIAVLRDGEEKTVTVMIGELPTEEELQVVAGRTSQGFSSRLGLRVSPLSPEQRAELGVDRNAGLVVEEVQKGVAQAAGLEVGDVILQVDGEWMESVERFHEIIGALPARRSVAILVHRDEGPVFLALRMPEK